MANMKFKTGVVLEATEHPDKTYEEIVEMTRANNKARREAEAQEVVVPPAPDPVEEPEE
jgi:hypothetical protein